MKSIFFLIVALLPFALHADEATIRKAFEERYANVPIKSVTATAIPGVYEVYAGGQILYADEKGDHLLMGPWWRPAAEPI